LIGIEPTWLTTTFFASIYNTGKLALLASWRDRPFGGEIQPALPLPASAIGSCASSAITACLIDARGPQYYPDIQAGTASRGNS